MNHRTRAHLAVLAWAATVALAGQPESAPRRKPQGPLAGLPSAPKGPHIARIQALGDDRWANLGPPAPDPKWGKARGRAWTPEMAYAPDLRAAFFCGCGIHGYVKPDGHYMDDLWAYDIHAHRWICVYPGADTKSLKLTLDEHGFEVNDAREHIPVSYLSHGYNNSTYIHHLRKYMVIHTQCPWWSRALPQRWAWLDQRYKEVRTHNYGHAGPVIENTKHPWFYDVAEARWERKFVAGDGPGPTRFEGVLEYIPARKQAFFLYRGEVWFYDFAKAQWVRAGAKKVDIGYDSNGCYASRRQRIYVARKQAFWCYDTKTNRWHSIRADGQPEDLGNSNSGCLTYDSAGDVVLWHRKGGSGIRIYHPDVNRWTAAARPPQSPQVIWKYRLVHGFYDPELNAHFYYVAGDSSDKGCMLAYRYRKAKK